jgi:hypothetical protein
LAPTGQLITKICLRLDGIHGVFWQSIIQALLRQKPLNP